MVNKPSGIELGLAFAERKMWYSEWVREISFVIMNCPPVRHYDRVLGDEEPIIPIILSQVMVVSKLVNWSPAKDFLAVSSVRRRTGVTLMMARM